VGHWLQPKRSAQPACHAFHADLQDQPFRFPAAFTFVLRAFATLEVQTST
jgi:hypothetical protein